MLFSVTVNNNIVEFISKDNMVRVTLPFRAVYRSFIQPMYSLYRNFCILSSHTLKYFWNFKTMNCSVKSEQFIMNLCTMFKCFRNIFSDWNSIHCNHFIWYTVFKDSFKQFFVVVFTLICCISFKFTENIVVCSTV